MIVCRPARASDAGAMCAIINPLIEAGGTTAHRTAFDPETMLAHYQAPPNGISCAIAFVSGKAAGFQALKRADPDYGGDAPLPDSWGYIATFVDVSFQGRGIGKALFSQTRRAARIARLEAIDATIMTENTGGIGFYSALGFEDYAHRDGRIAKKYDLGWQG